MSTGDDLKRDPLVRVQLMSRTRTWPWDLTGVGNEGHADEWFHLRKCSPSDLPGFSGNLRSGGRHESNFPAEIGEIESEK